MIEDITPVTNALLQLGATAITALGTVAIARLVQWLNIKNGDATRSALDEVLNKSVTFGLAESQDLIKAKGWDHVDVRNAAIAKALPYLIDRFPDVLRGLKLDPEAPETKLKMQDALLRALPFAALTASNSPATPPTTAPNPPVQGDLQPPGGLQPGV
jgi:hypothetical protein